MSYEFTKLSEVPAVSEFPEGANAIIETNGEIKRCPSSNTPKPLTYDYMPAGYPTKTMGTVTLLAEQELAFSTKGDGLFVAVLTNTLDVVGGQTYAVNWDGTEYECVCNDNGGYITLGNISIMGEGANTGEPFLFIPSEGNVVVTLETSASHTISITQTEETVTPMAKEFLPAGANSTTVFYYA